MKNNIILKLTAVIGISTITVSCIKDADKPVVGCEPAPQLMLPINVLDAGTSEDLFFSTSPKYPVSDLYFFRKADKSRKDTMRATVAGSATIKVFLLPLKNAAVGDTLIMKIKGQAEDTIIYSVKNGTGDCPYITLDKVSYNGNDLVPAESRYFIRK